jgi:DNA polymerase-3 subunit epsilon
MNAPPRPTRWAFVDLETTGMHPGRERVTEVAVITVDTDGASQRCEEWATLVNPGVPIPAEIQWLTGISNDMVRAAPPFADIVDPLLDRLHGALFIAHNARFDYGFLRAEFKRAGLNWQAATLCTVRLSRLLDADRGTHSLDALAARYRLSSGQRHRALGDARLICRWMDAVRARHGADTVAAAVERVLTRPSVPVHLPPEALDAIPHAPGVYLFYGLNAHPIYIGKAVDLAQRVAGHFNGDSTKSSDARLAQEVRRIEWEETAGELGALLREAELVRTRLPAHNIALRRKRNAVLLRVTDTGRPRYVKAAEVAVEHLPEHYGPFGSRAGARGTLLALAREHALCAKVLGLERGAAGAPCFARQLGRCLGACVGAELGAESAADHLARLHNALAPMLIARWPFAGAVALVERSATTGREDWQVFDQWCWLGSVATLDAAYALARNAERVFDPDIYRIAARVLQDTGADLVPLGA